MVVPACARPGRPADEPGVPAGVRGKLQPPTITVRQRQLVAQSGDAGEALSER
jgi:hypothetical protein